MKEYIEVDSLWKCETCFHHSTGKCSFDVWCENGESYRPSYNQLKIVSAKEIVYAEWEMVVDNYDDGLGNRELPHCTNCHRGVYIHDAGSWCPFCGVAMKNPMR